MSTGGVSGASGGGKQPRRSESDQEKRVPPEVVEDAISRGSRDSIQMGSREGWVIVPDSPDELQDARTQQIAEGAGIIPHIPENIEEKIRKAIEAVEKIIEKLEKDGIDSSNTHLLYTCYEFLQEKFFTLSQQIDQIRDTVGSDKTAQLMRELAGITSQMNQLGRLEQKAQKAADERVLSAEQYQEKFVTDTGNIIDQNLIFAKSSVAEALREMPPDSVVTSDDKNRLDQREQDLKLTLQASFTQFEQLQKDGISSQKLEKFNEALAEMSQLHGQLVQLSEAKSKAATENQQLLDNANTMPDSMFEAAATRLKALKPAEGHAGRLTLEQWEAYVTQFVEAKEEHDILGAKNAITTYLSQIDLASRPPEESIRACNQASENLAAAQKQLREFEDFEYQALQEGIKSLTDQLQEVRAKLEKAEAAMPKSADLQVDKVNIRNQAMAKGQRELERLVTGMGEDFEALQEQFEKDATQSLRAFFDLKKHWEKAPPTLVEYRGLIEAAGNEIVVSKKKKKTKQLSSQERADALRVSDSQLDKWLDAEEVLKSDIAKPRVTHAEIISKLTDTAAGLKMAAKPKDKLDQAAERVRDFFKMEQKEELYTRDDLRKAAEKVNDKVNSSGTEVEQIQANFEKNALLRLKAQGELVELQKQGQEMEANLVQQQSMSEQAKLDLKGLREKQTSCQTAYDALQPTSEREQGVQKMLQTGCHLFKNLLDLECGSLREMAGLQPDPEGGQARYMEFLKNSAFNLRESELLDLAK